MEYYAGIDVSLEESSVCVVDAAGEVVGEAKVASEPAALIAWFEARGDEVCRVGLEAGPLSQWLYAGMAEAGLGGGTAGDPPCACGVQDHAGEDRSQGRVGDCAADAARVVPSGSLQIAVGPGGAGPVDGAQAGAVQAARCGDEPAGGVAGFPV